MTDALLDEFYFLFAVCHILCHSTHCLESGHQRWPESNICKQAQFRWGPKLPSLTTLEINVDEWQVMILKNCDTISFISILSFQHRKVLLVDVVFDIAICHPIHLKVCECSKQFYGDLKQTSSSALHQLFVSSSSALCQSFISSSSALNQPFISSSSVLDQFFLAVLHNFFHQFSLFNSSLSVLQFCTVCTI